MFARVTTFEGSAEGIEEGVRVFREDVLPWLRDATGFRGALALTDRPGERVLVITFWATEEAAADRPESGAAIRDEIAARVGTPMQKLELFEVTAVDSLEFEAARRDEL